MGVLSFVTEADWKEIESRIKKCVKEVLLEDVEMVVEASKNENKKADA